VLWERCNHGIEQISFEQGHFNCRACSSPGRPKKAAPSSNRPSILLSPDEGEVLQRLIYGELQRGSDPGLLHGLENRIEVASGAPPMEAPPVPYRPRLAKPRGAEYAGYLSKNDFAVLAALACNQLTGPETTSLSRLRRKGLATGRPGAWTITEDGRRVVHGWTWRAEIRARARDRS
jgi:hypothetical protein